jgi:hypothetical protein
VAQTGTRTTFNSTVGLKIDLSDMLPTLVTPNDTPLLDLLSKGRPTIPAVKHEWLEDSLVASTDALTAMYTAGGGTITVTDFTVFKKGYVIRIDSELMRVSATPTANPVSVTTGYAGSTNANHSNGAVIQILGPAVTDGADPEQFITTNRVAKFNYMQVFQEAITVSDLENWAANYGVDDKYTYEVKKWLKTLAIRLDKTIAQNNFRFEDSTNSSRIMGGLSYFITTNDINVGGALSESNLNTQIKACFDNGGEPNTIVVSTDQKPKITALVAASQRWYKQGDLDNLTVGASAKRYISDFGDFNIVVDRHLPAGQLFILDTSTIKVITGKPFTHELLAKTGTADKGEIVGWYTLEVKAEQHSAFMFGLT